MPIPLRDLADDLAPNRTVLLFGSGSSLPSGAPSANSIIDRFSKKFGIPADSYSLSEMASLCEAKFDRHRVISELREMFGRLKPTGGLQNLPLYQWKSIFTTNYDNLIEQVYERRGKVVRIYHSNFNFTTGDGTEDVELFKIHGTIDKDVSDGDNSRIILSEADYQQTHQYRESLYDRLKGDLAGADLVVIGHSLADTHIKEIVDRAAAINQDIQTPARIRVLIYKEDKARASLLEQRGISVSFGGIDEFFAALTVEVLGEKIDGGEANTPLSKIYVLEPVTVDVSHSVGTSHNISSMFNGMPATYPDIVAGFTFQRKVAEEIETYFKQENSLTGVLLGASGVGKTTAARQVLRSLSVAGWHCYEHKGDHNLNATHWLQLAEILRGSESIGVLMVDDAHRHLQGVNDIIDGCVHADNGHLKILICSAKNHWFPRIKTPNLFKYGSNFELSKLSTGEIDRLLNLLDNKQEIQNLVEDQFSGFSRPERRRRLEVRCESDFFVCLKNIFANDTFDDIVLREFADLDEPLQDVYRHVAALEAAGIRVHRQLIIRLLGIDASTIEGILNSLTEIVTEYDISEKLGIYGWRARHPVISSIITKYKFSDTSRVIELFDTVIDNISPTYDIEIRSLRELCNVESGISSIPSKKEQNRLLRKMMSNAPGERVPRHRLIRNLIDEGAYEKAETEIRVFDKDFGSDGPVHRYKIKLLVERAMRSKGILNEDRIAILEQAHVLALQGVSRYPINKNILSVYAELGVEYYRLTGNYQYFDEAISNLVSAEEKLGDPQISAIIRNFQQRIAGQPQPDLEKSEESTDSQ